MTFGRFIESVKSALGLWSFISLVASIALVVGINFSVETVPGWAAAVLGTVTYVLGFLVACYQVAKSEAEGDRDESRISLADHEAAIDRETAPLRAAIEEKDAEISRLKELVESYDRVERERALRDMMDDYYQSGAEDVAVSPQPTADAQYDEAMRWMGRQ